MFKKDKHRSTDASSMVRSGSSTRLSDGRDSLLSPTPSNSEGANREQVYAFSQPSTATAQLQLASYQRGARSAVTAGEQIQSDKMEVINIIANHGVEPIEILHLGEFRT